MVIVRNNSDLCMAYKILLILEELKKRGSNERLETLIVEQKREIRYFHRIIPRRRIIKDYGDGFIELVELAGYIRSKEEASEYFERWMLIEARPSQYDCTGQAFTSRYKTFERHNRFFAYHWVNFDV